MKSGRPVAHAIRDGRHMSVADACSGAFSGVELAIRDSIRLILLIYDATLDHIRAVRRLK